MKTFEPNKNAKELNIDLTRKFIVVEKSGYSPHIGDILEIKEDDNSTNPLFWNLTRDSAYLDKHETEDKWKCVAYWSQLAYYEEPKTATEIRIEEQNRLATQTRPRWYSTGISSRLAELERQKEILNQYNKDNPLAVREQSVTKGNKTMSNIVSFFNDLTVSSEDKELRKAGLKNDELQWTSQAETVVCDLEAKERGYKSFDDLDNKLEFEADRELSVFEYEALFTKFYPKLLETAKKFNKREEKK